MSLQLVKYEEQEISLLSKVYTEKVNFYKTIYTFAIDNNLLNGINNNQPGNDFYVFTELDLYTNKYIYLIQFKQVIQNYLLELTEYSDKFFSMFSIKNNINLDKYNQYFFDTLYKNIELLTLICQMLPYENVTFFIKNP